MAVLDDVSGASVDLKVRFGDIVECGFSLMRSSGVLEGGGIPTITYNYDESIRFDLDDCDSADTSEEEVDLSISRGT